MPPATMSADPNPDPVHEGKPKGTKLFKMLILEKTIEQELCSLLDEGLSDPIVSRWHRAKYHIIRAWYENPEENIQDAKSWMEIMRREYQVEGETEEWIAKQMQSLQEMLDDAESSLLDIDLPVKASAAPRVSRTASGRIRGSASNPKDLQWQVLAKAPTAIAASAPWPTSPICPRYQLADSRAANPRIQAPPVDETPAVGRLARMARARFGKK
ncbi:hypothetical protein PRZ48_000599 [Zasmidium cellare]|uniref:Uncharacterized protein n=1 Tax=Zasmidium cellare TaxID=395010 RepID=A0ABR0EYX8_ZASCE|nr:hypothetical protein PRZ48_000599 [Zasmidium cellare]